MAQFQVNLRQFEAHMDTVRTEQRLLQDLETLLGQLTGVDVSELWHFRTARCILRCRTICCHRATDFFQEACRAVDGAQSGHVEADRQCVPTAA